MVRAIVKNNVLLSRKGRYGIEEGGDSGHSFAWRDWIARNSFPVTTSIMDHPIELINGSMKPQEPGTTLVDLRLNYPTAHLTYIEINVKSMLELHHNPYTFPSEWRWPFLRRPLSAQRSRTHSPSTRGASYSWRDNAARTGVCGPRLNSSPCYSQSWRRRPRRSRDDGKDLGMKSLLRIANHSLASSHFLHLHHQYWVKKWLFPTWQSTKGP